MPNLARLLRRTVIVTAVGSALALAATPANAAVAEAPIPKLPGGVWIVPKAINLQSLVVGQAHSGAGTIAFAQPRNKQPQQLRALAGWETSAEAVNDSGVIVGNVTTEDSATFSALLWPSISAEPQRLPSLSPTGSTFARDINASGQVLLDTGSDSYIWKAGAYASVATLTKGRLRTAVAINDKGHLVANTPTGPVLWNGTELLPLQTFSGPGYTSVSEVANDDSAVGHVSLSGRAVALAWTSAGVATQLATPAGYTPGHGTALATSVTAHGLAAGQYCPESAAGDEPCHAVVWKSGRVVDLGVGGVTDINEKDQAVGFVGTDDGVVWDRHSW